MYWNESNCRFLPQFPLGVTHPNKPSKPSIPPLLEVQTYCLPGEQGGREPPPPVGVPAFNFTMQTMSKSAQTMNFILNVDFFSCDWLPQLRECNKLMLIHSISIHFIGEFWGYRIDVNAKLFLFAAIHIKNVDKETKIAHAYCINKSVEI